MNNTGRLLVHTSGGASARWNPCLHHANSDIPRTHFVNEVLEDIVITSTGTKCDTLSETPVCTFYKLSADPKDNVQ